MAVLGLLFSSAQGGLQLWRWYQNWRANYEVEIKTPDNVNISCAGSEGVDQPSGAPICDGSNSFVFIANTLNYINKSEGDRSVLLTREIARIQFQTDGKIPIKTIVLTWVRVRGGADWELTTAQQIDPKKNISHATDFYPASFGCESYRPQEACKQDNTYAWSDFAVDITARGVKRAIFTFEPEFKTFEPDVKGTLQVPPRACEVDFDDSDVNAIQTWRKQLAEVQAEHLGQNLKGLISPPYVNLSHRCAEVPLAG